MTGALKVRTSTAPDTWTIVSGGVGGMQPATTAETIAGVDTTKAVTPAGRAAAQPYLDVRAYGAKGDGTTDDTTAITAAITAANVAGGIVLFPTGRYVTAALPALGNRVTLQGVGRSSILVHKAAAAASAHLLTTAIDAYEVQVRDLSINGDRANQTNAVDAIHFTNASGAPLTNARHVISNVHIENVKGTGLYLGFGMRSCQVRGVTIYFCDVYGVQLEAFADSQISDVEVGQSGGHGWYINNCNSIELNNIRSWYSGRINTGTNGHGFHIRDGQSIQVTNAFTQESSGNGFFLFGASGPLKGVALRNAQSNSDNVIASTWVGFALNNVEKAIISGTVTKYPAGTGTVSNALSVGGGSTGCIIDLTYNATAISSWAMVGADLFRNQIRLGQQYVAATYAASYTPLPYSNDTVKMTLTGPLTVNAPSMSPLVAGWQLRFILTQDATGGRVVTWNAVFKTNWTPDTGVNKTNAITFVCDGTNWWQVATATGL